MPLSPDQAADTLRDIARAERRSFSAYGYQSAAPYLILWGIIWIIGYSAADIRPVYAGDTWLALLVIGFIASGVIGHRAGRRAGNKGAAVGLRITATWIVMLAFFAAIFTIMAPVTGDQIGAFFPLFFGTVYVVMGIWMGLRFVLVGAAIVALTMFGFFFIHPHFSLWLAAVGGGALLLGGLWLRKA